MATDRNDNLKDNPDRNPDPITGAAGSHPIGTGVGAAGGGAAGAAIGAAVSGPAAPIGAVVGAVVGAVAGGYAGKGAAEAVNPTAEDQYWRSTHSSRPYYEKDYDYDKDYRPAYQHGWNATTQHQGKTFDEVEPHLQSDWDRNRGESRLGWDKAKYATRDAFDRLRGNESGSGTSSITAGSASAYPGHTSDAGSTPSSVSTTGNTSGTDMGTFSGTRTGGMDDRTGGLMGTQIGGSTYADNDRDFDEFTSTARTRYHGRNFDEVENDLRNDWSSRGGTNRSSWDKVRDKVRSGWHKVERAMPGDADRDGR